MDHLINWIWHDGIWHNGKFLGVEWNAWKVAGFLGNAVFSSRVFVQWYVAERKKQVVVPVIFWWLSLLGSMTLLAYGLFYNGDSVFILAYAFAWIPYIRNIMIHHRHMSGYSDCRGCGKKIPPQSNYCPNCGGKVAV